MAVLQGTVVREKRPLEGAYVRLLGPSGEYVSERRTKEDGAFKFNIFPGKWSLIWLAPGSAPEQQEIDISENGLELTLEF